MLDGEPLTGPEVPGEGAYVPQPFPAHPPAPGYIGAKKGMAPFALWAALQLAAGDTRSSGQTVLISVVEGIANFAGWCAALLDENWQTAQLPPFFIRPGAESAEGQLFDLALRVTEDLFGEDSRELRLLRRGIVLHHGRMPGRLPRILVELVERRVIRVVIATSTLTQGVNLPFETILVPGLTRQSGRITPQEFANLIGRAGRPGVATEGQALVLLLQDLSPWQRARAQADYVATVSEWVQGRSASAASRSPLAALINLISERWQGVDPDAFESWLETTAVGEAEPGASGLLDALDALDGVILAVLEEGVSDVDESLRRVWGQTFAHYASAEEARLERAFLARGRAVSRRFQDPGERRRLYQTSLAPRDARDLYAAVPDLVAHLQTGTDYWRWSPDERFQFVERTIEFVSRVRRFSIAPTVGQGSVTWQQVLRWWLDPSRAPRKPTVAQVGAWHEFIARWFSYQFAWGLAAMTLLRVPPDAELTPDLWSGGDIPFAGLWLKDLLMWGTLDPVAAYALSRRLADVRSDAEALANGYYQTIDLTAFPDPLDPMAIRAWAAAISSQQASGTRGLAHAPISVRLSPRILENNLAGPWRVLPIPAEEAVDWVDVAGYVLATSGPLPVWAQRASTQLDFMLTAPDAVIEASPYL